MSNYSTSTKFLGAWNIIPLNSVDSEGTGIYRVRRDSHLLGIFHRDIANGLWISQPCNSKLAPRFETSNDAVMFIIEMDALAAA